MRTPTINRPVRIAHLTDLHVSSLDAVGLQTLLGKRALGYRSWRRKRRHQHSWERLNATLALTLREAPDALVITGDLLHIGLRDEMRQLRSWLQRVAEQLPVLLVPGNHDLYRADSVRAWQEELGDLPVYGEPLQPTPNDRPGSDWPRVLDVANVRVVGLNSAYAAPLLQATGQLGEQQLEELAKYLRRSTMDTAPPEHWLFAIHHPPDASHVSARKRLLDGPALCALLQEVGSATLVHGHLHTNLEYQCGDARVFCTAPASSTGTAKHEATARLIEFSASPVSRLLVPQVVSGQASEPVANQ